MNSAARTTLTWFGRLFLLAVPFVILCSLYSPQTVQFLNPVACGPGLSLDRQGRNPNTPFDNRATCESDTAIVSANGRILGLAGVSFAVAVGAYSLRSRITPRSLSAPPRAQHA